MRIWKGTEREDHEHKMTLFVETKIVNQHVVEVVKEKLKENPDAVRVYFGAGGVTCPETIRSVTADLSEIKAEKVVEVHSRNIACIDPKVFDKVIMTTPVPSLEKIVPKIETEKVLKVFAADVIVDFSEVVDGCYNNDVEIYKE